MLDLPGRPSERPSKPSAESLSARCPSRRTLPGLEPERTITDWGRSERVGGLLEATVGSFLYHYWFRVRVEGIENVPGRGGALLVANRAGGLRIDAAMIAHAVREEHERPRPLQIACAPEQLDLPGLGMLATKLGAVSDHVSNLQRLLFDERQLVLAFPERRAPAVKTLRSRYRLRPFESLPFVQIAARAGVPIVPVVVVGAEEATPTLASLGPLTRHLRLRVGVAVPLPARFTVRFLQPVRADVEGGRDEREATALAEQVRGLIQENLYELLASRGSVWLG